MSVGTAAKKPHYPPCVVEFIKNQYMAGFKAPDIVAQTRAKFLNSGQHTPKHSLQINTMVSRNGWAKERRQSSLDVEAKKELFLSSRKRHCLKTTMRPALDLLIDGQHPITVRDTLRQKYPNERVPCTGVLYMWRRELGVKAVRKTRARRNHTDSTVSTLLASKRPIKIMGELEQVKEKLNRLEKSHDEQSKTCKRLESDLAKLLKGLEPLF